MKKVRCSWCNNRVPAKGGLYTGYAQFDQYICAACIRGMQELFEQVRESGEFREVEEQLKQIGREN